MVKYYVTKLTLQQDIVCGRPFKSDMTCPQILLKKGEEHFQGVVNVKCLSCGFNHRIEVRVPKKQKAKAA